MSIAAIAWVFKQPLKPAWLKFALIGLADCANDEGHCYPSIKYLCIKTSLNRKTVIAALDLLEQRGYLIDTGQRKGVTKQVKVYQLRVPSEGFLNDTVDGTLSPERVPSVPSKSPVCTTKESRARDTESSGTVIEPHERKLTSKEEWKRRLEAYDPSRPMTTWKAFWGRRPDSGPGDGILIPADLLADWRKKRISKKA